MKKPFVITFLLSSVLNIWASDDILNIDINEIKWDNESVPSAGSPKKELIGNMFEYIKKNPDPYNEYIILPREENLNWDKSPEILNYVNYYKEVIEEKENYLSNLNNIKEILEKKGKYEIQEPGDKLILKKLINNAIEEKNKEDKSVIVAQNMYNLLSGNFLRSKGEKTKNLSQKDLNNASSELEKGKVSKKLLTLINPEYDRVMDSIKYFKTTIDKIIQDPIQTIKNLHSADVTYATTTFYDTVPNPYFRDKAYNDKDINFYYNVLKPRLIEKDWEWIYNEKADLVEEDFPIGIRYYRYASHPDLRLVNGKYESWSKYKYDRGDQNDIYLVFDNKGNLIRVLKTGESAPMADDFRYNKTFDRHDERGIGRQIAILEYQDNKYDIKSQPKKVQDYIQLQLGLRKPTTAEKAKSDKAVNEMAKAAADYTLAGWKHGSQSKKGKKAQDKAAMQFLGALIGGSDTYSSEGGAWFSQIEKDNYPYFQHIYDLQRIDDTTFRCVIVDNDLKPIYELIFEYNSGDEPYSIKENITVKRR